MADMLTQLYLAATLYHKEKFGLNHIMYNICLSELNKEFCESFKHLKNGFITKNFYFNKNELSFSNNHISR